MTNDSTTILIVDDQAVNRQILKDQVQILGHDFLLAEDGRMALELIEEQQPDLMLLDIMMPQMDGHAVLTHLREKGILFQLPVIVISALDDIDNIVRCIQNGAEDYLTKPINSSLLSARINNCLEKKRLHDQEKILYNQIQMHNQELEEQVAKQVAQISKTQRLEAIGTLAGGIAHDFNNILAAMIGYTEMVLQDISQENSSLTEDLKRVLLAGERAKKLVRQILTFSRETEQKAVPVELKPLIGEAIKFLRATLPASIEIQEKIAGNLGAVLADPTQMYQVIMNLCTNAFHAMKENGGVLEICLTLDENHDFGDNASRPCQKITIKDTGCGIDSETLPRIFDPFFTTKEAGEGTGLGLAVVHGIVTGSNGEIIVNSEVGVGTTLEIYLPRIDEEEIKEVLDDIVLPTGNERVLVVDDEELLAELLRRTLTSLGYDVATQTSSLEALEIFGSDSAAFDLIITDLTMPQVSGMQLAVKARQIRPDIPIIITTGNHQKHEAEKAHDLGVAAVLVKPVTKLDLAVVVRATLDQMR